MEDSDPNFSMKFMERAVAGLGPESQLLFTTVRRDKESWISPERGEFWCTHKEWRDTGAWYVQDLEAKTSLGGVAAYKRFNPESEVSSNQFTFELVEWKVGEEQEEEGPGGGVEAAAAAAAARRLRQVQGGNDAGEAGGSQQPALALSPAVLAALANEQQASAAPAIEPSYAEMDVAELIVSWEEPPGGVTADPPPPISQAVATEKGLKGVGRNTKAGLIEEIKFFEANGRQGVRSRATRRLE